MISRSPSDRGTPLGERSASGERVPSEPDRVAVLVDEIAENEAAALQASQGGDPTAPPQSTVHILDTLKSLGYDPVELSLAPDRIAEWLGRIMNGDFRFAFNLCETIAGRADGEHLAAAAVQLLKLPMTGASAETLLLCLDKDRCSAILRAHGVSVPDWRLIRRHDPPPSDWDRFPAIVKPAAEDASNGVHPYSVVRSRDELLELTERLRRNFERLVVQQYIEGREINLAIVGQYLLPPSEIDFSALPEDSPPIVSFEAKWKTGSPEDLGTQPVCPAPLPAGQARDLQLLAGRVWRLMEGRGYARVDVRLTPDGTPYVIDINPNPDLSYDAGLARQAQVAGWSYEELIKRIVQEALAAENGDGSGSAGWTILQPVNRAES